MSSVSLGRALKPEWKLEGMNQEKRTKEVDGDRKEQEKGSSVTGTLLPSGAQNSRWLWVPPPVCETDAQA